MGALTKNLPKNVGNCPFHHLQLIARNLVFEIFRSKLPLKERNKTQRKRGKVVENSIHLDYIGTEWMAIKENTAKLETRKERMAKKLRKDIELRNNFFK